MKNIYKIFINILALALIAVSMSSCLNKMPTDFIPEGEAMTTFEEARQVRTGIYSTLKNPSLFSGILTLAPDVQSDFVYAVEGNSNQYGNIWQWDFLSTSSEIEAVYAGLYTVIGRCNYFLDKVDDVKANIIDDEELTRLDSYIGEVHGIRALAYSELLKMYCKAYDPATAANEKGLVLRTSYFKKEPTVRASLEDTYKFVISDLLIAEDLLDDLSNEEYDHINNAVSFTEAAAHALHARIALYMQDWDEAIRHSTIVMETPKLALADAKINITGNVNSIDYMWQYDGAAEIIFMIGFTPTSYGGSLGSMFLNFTTDFTYFYPDYVPANWVLNLYDQGDARYNAYFRTGKTGYPHGLECPLLFKYFGNREFIDIKLYHMNMPKPLRLAEQYLIRAEAYCNKGQFGAASKDLSDLSQSRHISGGSLSVSADNWKDKISNERVKELYMEGFRLNDLKRWGRGFERTPQQSVQKEGSSLKVKAGDARFVWPIPKHEIEAPGSDVEQN